MGLVWLLLAPGYELLSKVSTSHPEKSLTEKYLSLT